MNSTLAEIEAQALQLSPHERGALATRLIASLHNPTVDTPETVANAWDEEIARRVAEMDAGRTQWIPAEQVMKELDEIIATARGRCA